MNYLAQRHPGVTVGEPTRPNDGLSSETYLVRASWDGADHDLVARLAPAEGLFPDYDLGLQARLQGDLPALGVRTAAPLAFVEDRSWVDAPFLLMDRVDGRVLSDNPPFAREGWLHDAGEEVQRAAFTGFLDALAAIHRVDAAAVGYAARRFGAGLTGEVAWWSDYLIWATDGAPPLELAVTLEWCRDHMPDPEPPAGLLWGDVRLGNVLFDDGGTPTAVLDWEMASIGPAEVDLGWFFALREMALPRGAVELPGFLDRDAALAYYAARLGREIGDLTWYERFALVRSTAILIRTQRLLVAQGQHDHWLVGFDPIPRRLKKFVAAP